MGKIITFQLLDQRGKTRGGQNGSILPAAKFHDFSFEDMTFLKCLNLSVFLRIYWLVRRIRQGEKK